MRNFSLKMLLTRLLAHPRATQVLKWIVYGSLLINCLIYFHDDYLAYTSSLPVGAPLDQVLAKFSTTIDTGAWLALVFLFEFETYLLSDAAYKSWIGRTLIPARLVCYVLIGSATFGYIVDANDYHRAEPLTGLNDLCTIADKGRYVQTDAINYVEIRSDTCDSFAKNTGYFSLAGEVSVISASTLAHAAFQAWLNVVNAIVWLLIVFLIEIEIRFQHARQFTGPWITFARQLSTVLYGVLIVIALVWFFTGYGIYTWDAALWIAGFWAIELNLAEWEQDQQQSLGETSQQNL